VSKLQLPIDQVKSTNGIASFKWRQRVTSPIGVTWVEYEGPVPTTLEQALSSLIGIAKQQARVIEKLTAENGELRRQMAKSDDKTTECSRVTV
jgi:hypothetical protein